MADHDVISSAAQQRGERAASSQQGVWSAQSHLAEQMRNMAEQGEFLTAPSLEAHGELGLHLGTAGDSRASVARNVSTPPYSVSAGDVQHAQSMDQGLVNRSQFARHAAAVEALLRHRSSCAPKPLTKIAVARGVFDAPCKLGDDLG